MNKTNLRISKFKTNAAWTFLPQFVCINLIIVLCAFISHLCYITEYNVFGNMIEMQLKVHEATFIFVMILVGIIQTISVISFSRKLSEINKANYSYTRLLIIGYVLDLVAVPMFYVSQNYFYVLSIISSLVLFLGFSQMTNDTDKCSAFLAGVNTLKLCTIISLAVWCICFIVFIGSSSIAEDIISIVACIALICLNYIGWQKVIQNTEMADKTQE